MDIEEPVCSCWAELSCSEEIRLVVGQGEGIREMGTEKIDDAWR